MKSLKIIMILAVLVICCALAVGCTDGDQTETTNESTSIEDPASTESGTDAQTGGEGTVTGNSTVTGGASTSANTPADSDKPAASDTDKTPDASVGGEDDTTVNKPAGDSTPTESNTSGVTPAVSTESDGDDETTPSDANMDLKFVKTQDEKGYVVIDYGTCTDKSVVIPAYYDGLPVVMIDARAFANEKIVSVVIPDTVVTIGANAFDLCIALESVTLSANLKTLGDGAFADCGALKAVVLPNTLTSVGNGAFAGCHALVSIGMNGSGAFKTEGNCLIHVATNTVVAGCRQSVIPDGVKIIAESAFARLTMLTKINIPASVERIEKNAFYGCVMLKTVSYAGTEAAWQKIVKGTDWNASTGSYTLKFA